MLRVESLAKRFGEIRAVDRVSFEVRDGELYGLLGPNGAGKTTTMSMIAGLLAPDEGRVVFDGVDLAADPIRVKAQLGVVPQEVALYDTLSARENLRFWGGIYGLAGADLAKAVDRALELVGLGGRAKEPVKRFSGGMKRRLNLALGLVHSPKTVLMDEPTVGIDPQARLRILEAVKAVAASGTTVLYTTHYLEEAETLCHRIGIMDHGKLLAEGTLEELKRQSGGRDLVSAVGAFSEEEARARLAGFPDAQIVTLEVGRLVLSIPAGRGAVEALGALLVGTLRIETVSIQPPSLNGLFINLTGRELRD